MGRIVWGLLLFYLFFFYLSVIPVIGLSNTL